MLQQIELVKEPFTPDIQPKPMQRRLDTPPAESIRLHYISAPREMEEGSKAPASASPSRMAGRPVLQRRAGPAEMSNLTGIPTPMLRRAEQLGNLPLDDVRVHYRSSRPAALGALAYAQGTHIFLGPGQERHLGHELCHVVQQKQGIVRPNFQLGNMPVNTSPALEREADHWDALLAPLVTAGWSTTVPEPDAVQMLTTAQFFFPELFSDLVKFLKSPAVKKSSCWTLIDVTLNAIQSMWRVKAQNADRSTPEWIDEINNAYICEIFNALFGALAQAVNFSGINCRKSEGSMDECNYILAIISNCCAILADIGSIIGGATGRANLNSASKVFNDYFAPISAIASGLLGLIAIAKMLCCDKAEDKNLDDEQQCKLCGQCEDKWRSVADMLAVLADMLGQLLSLFGQSYGGALTLAVEAGIRFVRYISTLIQFNCCRGSDRHEGNTGAQTETEPPSGNANPEDS